MSIQEAHIHAERIWKRTVRKLEAEGYTVKIGRKRKTLVDALSEARKGMSKKDRIERLCKTLNMGVT